MGYRSTNKAVYSAKYRHTAPQGQSRYRRRVLVGRVEARLHEIIAEVVAERGASTIEVEVMADHVHLLVGIPPTVALSRFVGLVKGRSSRLLRAEFAHLRRMPALWSPSWLVSTVAGAPLEVDRRYVENHQTAA